MSSDADDGASLSGDDGFEEDMEALRRACFLTGTDPESLRPSSTAADSESEEDDFELVRGIRQRFKDCCSEPPLTIKPLNILLPQADGDEDDDDEDDFAILRSIQKRFSRYDQDTDGVTNSREEQEEVRAGETYFEKRTPDNVELEKTATPKAVPDSLDMHNTPDSLETLGTNFPDAFSSCFTEGNETDFHDSAMVPTQGCGFPKAAQMFVEAIRKNRACQKFIRTKLMQTEARIEENKKLQHRVKVLRGFQIRCKRETTRALSQKQDARLQLISAAKSKGKSKADGKKESPLYHGPADNAQVACYKMVLSEYHMSLSRRKWTDEERENLVKGIKQQFQELLLQKSVDLISDMEGDSEDVDGIYKSIRECDITPENMRLFLPKVNWERLASMYVKGRSGAECELRWLNWEDPLINHKPWTKVEDKKLLHIVQQRGISNWIEIAVLSEINRTPFQCLARYQRSLNASVIRREWSKNEDEKLCAAVRAFGESNWENVAATLVGRTGPQCSNRWLKSLNPARVKTGRWSLDEDKRMKVAVVFFGPNWKKVSQFVPGRTHVQCRERWVNNLDPNLRMGEWTEEEDSKLKSAIIEHGYCWSKVASCVASRTDNQCTRRWKTLFPLEVPLLRAARKIQKTALISNFVDREAERPALGPDDFLPLTFTDEVSECGELNQSEKQRRKPRSKNATKEAQKNNSKKNSSRRRKKDKEASEATEDAIVGQEIVPLDGETQKKKITRRRKTALRVNNATKEDQITNGDRTSLKKRRRRNKEASEDARIGQENVLLDGEPKKRSARKRKLPARYDNGEEGLIYTDETLLTNCVDVKKVAGEETNSKKATRRSKKNEEVSEANENARVGEEGLIYTDETLLTNCADVEKVAGEETNSKKATRRYKKNKEVSEANENARVGQDIVHFDKETKKNLTTRKQKMASRSKNATSDAQNRFDVILLTKDVEVEKVASGKPNLKKRPIRQCEKTKAVFEATEAARVGQESVPFDGETKKKKILVKRQMMPREGPIKRITDPTNSRASACGDSEVVTMVTVEEVGEHIGYKGGANNKISSKLRQRKNEQCRQFYEVASSFGENEAFSEVRRLSSPRLEQDWHADSPEVNSSPCTNSKSSRKTNASELHMFANDGKKKEGFVISCSSRIKCGALLCEDSDISEISNSETLGSIALKNRAKRRRLKKQSGLNHSFIQSDPMINKVAAVDNEKQLISEINRYCGDIETLARDHACLAGERKGRKPRERKCGDSKLGNNFGAVDGHELGGGEGGDMILASLIKRKRKKRKLGSTLKTPPLGKLSNGPAKTDLVDVHVDHEDSDSDTCFPPPGFEKPVYSQVT